MSTEKQTSSVDSTFEAEVKETLENLTTEVSTVKAEVTDVKKYVRLIEKEQEQYRNNAERVNISQARLHEEHNKLRDSMVDVNLHIHLIEQNIELSKQINNNIANTLEKKVDGMYTDFKKHFSTDDEFRRKTIGTLATILGTTVIGFLGIIVSLIKF